MHIISSVKEQYSKSTLAPSVEKSSNLPDIDGLIFSSVRSNKNNLQLMVNKCKKEILLDPQIYTLDNDTSFDTDHYKELFGVKNTDSCEKIISQVININKSLNTTKIITPNICLKNLGDWKSTKTNENYIKKFKFIESSAKINSSVELYQSLILDVNALNTLSDFFISDILDKTSKSQIKGFYILINSGTKGYAHMSKLNESKILSNLMFLNYSLAENNFKIINGCSDILAPFLNLKNEYITGATGYSSKFRVFDIEHHDRPEPGTQSKKPTPRYLSLDILCRLKYPDLKIRITDGKIKYNKLPSDKFFKSDETPKERHQIQQTFETLKFISRKTESLADKEKVLDETIDFIKKMSKTGSSKRTFEDKAKQLKLLENLKEGLVKFKRKAQI